VLPATAATASHLAITILLPCYLTSLLPYYLTTLLPCYLPTLLLYCPTSLLSYHLSPCYLTTCLSYYQAALFRSTLVTAVAERCRLLRWPPGDHEPTTAATASAAAAATFGPPGGARPPEGGRAGGAGAGGAGEWAGRGAVPCDCPYAPLQACMLWACPNPNPNPNPDPDPNPNPNLSPSPKPNPNPSPNQAWMLRAWARKSGAEARVRSWSFDQERATLSLIIGPENRWCAHVQRFHRSNGISLRADLRPGRRCLVQHCFDADCRAAGNPNPNPNSSPRPNPDPSPNPQP